MIQLVSQEGRHMVQLTHGLDPAEVFDTQYGQITASAWMAYEADRIMKQPPRLAEVRPKGKRLELWVDCQASGCSCHNPAAWEKGGAYRGD